jgi:broad specificity phosphatase PhoE
MGKIYFLRHFKPHMDKCKPVAEWGLDKEGKAEMQKLLNQDRFKDLKNVLTSPEPKAKISAEAFHKKYGIPITLVSEVSEVDRSKAGYIEGDYTRIVESYLTESEDFEYDWEDINQVKERIKKFVKILENKEFNVLVVSHGMYLSLMLSEYFNKEVVEFWKNLKFGQILEVDYKKLKDIWS